VDRFAAAPMRAAMRSIRCSEVPRASVMNLRSRPGITQVRTVILGNMILRTVTLGNMFATMAVNMVILPKVSFIWYQASPMLHQLPGPRPPRAVLLQTRGDELFERDAEGTFQLWRRILATRPSK